MRLNRATAICLLGTILAYAPTVAAQVTISTSNPTFINDLLKSLETDFQRSGAKIVELEDLNNFVRPPLILKLIDGSMYDKFRVLDPRPKADYDAGHIPKAVWVDLKAAQTIAARPDGLTDVDAWSEWSEPLGLTPDMAVAIIDGDRQLDAARVWWLLRYIGVSNVSLANGNLELWKIQQRPVTRDVPNVPPNPYPIDFQTGRLATRADVLRALEFADARIVDARSLEEWTGQNVRAKRGGHMPTACRLEWLEFVDKYGRFLSPEKIKAKLATAGVKPGEPVITHCQSGGRASVDAFVFEALGYPTRNYYLSWADWGNADDTPITTDEAPPAQLAVPVAVTPREQPAPEPVQIAVAPDPAPNPAQPNPQPAAKPFTAEYYYKCHWGRSDEFLALFQRNHLPILRERIKQGDILKVSMSKPRIHENESGRWDYRVTIEFRDAASAFDPAADQAIKERLFPNQIQYRKDEQSRFEILDAHWDLPTDAVDLDMPVIVP